MTKTKVEQKQESHTSAGSLQKILVALLIVLVGGVCVGFYFGQKYLKNLGLETSRQVADAQSGDAQVSGLTRLRKELEKNKVIAEKAKTVVAESGQYKYQDQIITDLTKFANQSGVPVIGFVFGQKDAVTGSDATASTTPKGVKSTSVAITIGTGASYNQFLNFMRLIERNVTKMQLTQLALTRDSSEKQDVQVGSFTLEVYING